MVSTGNNLSCVLYGINDLRIESNQNIYDQSQLQPNDVLLQPMSVGICGSDVHYVTHGEIGPFKLIQPMILGHETSARVIAIGSNVSTLQPGDRVAVEVGVSCRLCHYCKSGRYNLCRDMRFAATPPYNGTLTSHIVYPSDYCYKLPDTVTYDQAALIEPLSVAIHAVKRAQVTMGHTVLITGCGPIGLVNCIIARINGASTIIMTDINDVRLNSAQQFGADYVVNTNNTTLESILAEHNLLIDVSIECSGNESALCTALNNTQSGGRVVIVGHGESDMKLPIGNAMIRELDICGVFRYNNTYQVAINLIASNKIDVINQLITQHYNITDATNAFDTAKNGVDKDGRPAIKVMIHVGNPV